MLRCRSCKMTLASGLRARRRNCKALSLRYVALRRCRDRRVLSARWHSAVAAILLWVNLATQSCCENLATCQMI